MHRGSELLWPLEAIQFVLSTRGREELELKQHPLWPLDVIAIIGF